LRLGLLALGLLLLASLAAACGSSDERVAATTTTVAGRSPTELALAEIRADETQAARVSTSAEGSPEGGGPTTVTVLQEGLADDSVEAVRHVLRFEPDGDGWRLVSKTRTQRCQPGRGHRAFTSADCV
jgi:hypothetical protein